jgi:putative oxidoreductase
VIAKFHIGVRQRETRYFCSYFLLSTAVGLDCARLHPMHFYEDFMSSSNFTAALTARSPLVLSILRIVAGLTYMEHGTQKLFNFPASERGAVDLFSFFGFAGTLELVFGAAIILGLFTRFSAFILSGMMAVAYFMAHFPKSFFPVINGGDAAILFCFIFLYLVFAGGGPLSLDRKIFNRD